MTAPEPLAVYDVRESWPPVNLDKFLWWLREQGIDEGVTYRIELFSTDHRFARVHQYELNESGKPYCPHDHDHLASPEECEIARREPFEVPITSLPQVKPPSSDRSVT